VSGILFDLLMAVMDSLEVWAGAAGDREGGLAWRDAVTARMIAAGSYVPYEDLVVAAAVQLGLAAGTPTQLFQRWRDMAPRPDAAAITRLTVPYGFVTNCSDQLARLAADRSGLRPVFVLSAEQAGLFKPDPRIYSEACRMLGTPPERTAFVAGSVYDSEGAWSAGLRAVLVRRRTDERIPGSGVRLVGSLGELVMELSSETRNPGA
jgi:2-haloacid dehalogenase